MIQDYLQQVISEAHKKRFAHKNKPDTIEQVRIKDEWIDNLLALPYFSSNSRLTSLQFKKPRSPKKRKIGVKLSKTGVSGLHPNI